MGLWSRLQRTLWTGEVLKDYGVMGDRRIGSSHRTLSLVFTDKHGGRVFLKESWRAAFGFSVHFIELDAEESARLQEALRDAIPRLRQP
jgi:hypothetical protein